MPTADASGIAQLDAQGFLLDVSNPASGLVGTSIAGFPIWSDIQTAAHIARPTGTWADFTSDLVLTYTFDPSQVTTGHAAFDAGYQLVTRDILAQYAQITGLTFVEVTGNTPADLTFENIIGQQGGGGNAGYPSAGGSTINIGYPWTNGDILPGAYVYDTILHEVGHALGLAHPGPYNGSADRTTQTDYWNDSLQYTVMSYYGESYTGGAFSNAATPLLHDILALQMEYGANTSTRTGDTTYGYHNSSGLDSYDLAYSNVNDPTAQFAFCIWDAGGNDTLDFSGSSAGTVLDLRQGGFSSVNGQVYNVSIAYGAIIEQGIGSSLNDLMRGNEVGNALTGGNGNDTIYGGELVQPVIAPDPADFIGIQLNEDPLVRNQYLIATGISSFSGASFTFEEMVLLTRVPAKAVEFASYNVSGNDNQFILESNADLDSNAGGYLQLTIAGKAAYVTDISTERLVDGDPHRLSLTWDRASGAVGVYIDGQLAHSGTYTAAIGQAIGSGGRLVLGQEQDNTTNGGFDTKQVFQGTMGDIRIWNSALGAPAIASDAFAALTGSEAGLVHNWQVSTGTTTSVGDVVSGGTTLAVVNGATVVDTAPVVSAASDDDTLFGGAGLDTLYGGWGSDTLHGDGAGVRAAGTIDLLHLNTGYPDPGTAVYDDQQLNLGNATVSLPISASASAAMTVEMLLHFDSSPGTWDTILAYSSGGEWDPSYFTLYGSSSGKFRLYVGDTGYNTDVSIASFMGDHPARLSISWDNATGAVKLYVDGDLADSITVPTGQSIPANGHLWLMSGWDDIVYGEIGDIRVWNDALGAQQVSDNAWTELADPANTAGLVANWQVDPSNPTRLVDAAGHAANLTVANVTAGHPLVTDRFDYSSLYDDQLFGGAGEDVLYGEFGNDTLTGGADSDTAQFTGASSEYQFVYHAASNTVVVTDSVAGRDGTDTLSEIETLHFTDGTVLLGAIVGTAPTDIALSATAIDENVAIGALVGTLSATDTTPGETFSYALVGATGGLFAIDNSDHSLRVAAALNYESVTSQTLTIRVTDGQGNSFDEGFTIRVNDLNERPTGVALSSTTVAENSAAGTLVATLAGSDPDAGQSATLAFTLADPSGPFEIVGNELRVKAGATLDYEATPSYDITVVATDTGGLFLQRTFTIDIGNLDPEIITGTPLVDTLAGGAGSDVIAGLDGADTLDGGVDAGATATDRLIGGGSDDRYIVRDARDVVVEAAGEGTDTVESYVTYILGANVENLVLLGGGALNGTGNSLSNLIAANDGNNLLDGSSGVDTVSYARSGAGVTVSLVSTAAQATGGSGSDRLLGFENIIGSAFADTLTGTSAANVIEGGAGADRMFGGAGLDTLSYASSSAGVTVSLNGAGMASTADGDATGDEATGFESVIGSAYRDYLTGDLGDNVIDGGAGADVMAGSLGNDTYVVDDASDGVFEIIGGGTDTIRSYISLSLGDFQSIENLTLIGSAAIDGTGGYQANVITGNAAANVLDGSDDGQADRLVGGAGDDTYVVYDQLDLIIELAGQGIDTVRSSGVSYTLGANLENLVLTGVAHNGTGNGLANILTANAADNLLDGGAGTDTASYATAATAVIVDLALTTAQDTGGSGRDTLRNIEGVIGSGDADQLTGNAAANIIEGGGGGDTLTGGGGADTLSYAGSAAGVTVTLNGLAAATTDGGDAVGDVAVGFTHLTGSAQNDRLTGDSRANVLAGLAGDDTLDGGLGVDRLIGGLGDDTYRLDQVSDVVVELAGEGTDTIEIAASYILGANVENLTLKDIAIGSNDLAATGNTLANALKGNAGKNKLDGKAGADAMAGGAGDDTYYVDDLGDTVSESNADGSDSGGTDAVNSSVSFTLGSYVENLTLTGSAAVNGTGNTLANTITGNSGANVLVGGLGNDRLDGGGGIDTVSYAGTAGSVTVDISQPTGTAAGAAGSDTLLNLENVTGGDGADSLTGNAGSNTLDGGAGIDTLYGLAGNDILIGGLGGDQLHGGAGNDTYYVDDADDTVIEAAATDGTDTVIASLSWTLHTGDFIENLTLAGRGNLDATGNNLANILTGNAGDNRLDGGLGADAMAGGLGNDTYVVDATLDRLTEAAGAGTDTVEASVTWTLASYFENLTLKDVVSGSNDLTATGNDLANVLKGNAGNNRLDGKTGADSMLGGAGNDTYVVDNLGDTVSETNADGSDSGGTDTVNSSVTFVLGTNIENLTLTGAANINATGNALANSITGNSGVNILVGGLGNDRLDGGAGSDTASYAYVTDPGTTVAVDLSATTVQAILTGGETDTLIGIENLTGGAGSDSFLGNSLANVLDGGSGADTMAGGAGNDTYYVDNAGDVVTEFSAADGIDTVISSLASYSLSPFVDNLTLLAGAGSIDGTGNELANILTGNEGDNRLDGGGGADKLLGGLGSDTYIVDHAGDVVTEVNDATPGNADHVRSSVTFALGNYLENLTLTGSNAINGTGNALANVIVGNDAANTLRGGAGNDTITGGGGNDLLYGDAGSDTFVFELGDGADTIYGWEDAATGSQDRIDLSVYAGLTGFGDLVITVTGANIQIGFGALGTDTITLAGVATSSNLSGEDFIFAAPA
jgi:Ca2+-binding RTX toxin-like protein